MKSWYRKCLAGCFIHTFKVIHVPNFSSLGWFSFSSTVLSCWQLIKMKVNLESWNFAQVSALGCRWKFQSRFFCASCYQSSTLAQTTHLLGTCITLKVCIKHPSQHFLYQLSSAINSCQKLVKIKSTELKFGTHIAFGVKIKILILINKWEEVNSYPVKPVLAELGKNTRLIWVQLSLARSGLSGNFNCSKK